MAQHYDLIAIGGGSGGLSVVERAARQGARCALIEAGRLGGACVNVGCVPKKVMWYAAHLAHVLDDAPGYGFKLDYFGFDWQKLKTARDRFVSGINEWYRGYLAEAGVDLIRGSARFVDARTLEVGDERYSADHIVIATGSRPQVPNLPGAQFGITSDGFFELNACPARVAIVGSGYIAVELAGMLHALGAEVTVLVRKDHLLRPFDAMLREQLLERLREDGIAVLTRTQVRTVARLATGAFSLHCEGSGSAPNVNAVLWAIGRDPNTDALDLTAAGVTTNPNGAIPTDPYHSTIKFFILTRWVPVAYAMHAAARYFNEEVGSSRPKSLPFMCLAESRKGKSRLATVMISSNCWCGSSASTMPRITSISASIRECCCRLPTVHAGRWFSMRARCWG